MILCDIANLLPCFTWAIPNSAAAEHKLRHSAMHFGGLRRSATRFAASRELDICDGKLKQR
jgi:hypothetical protein